MKDGGLKDGEKSGEVEVDIRAEWSWCVGEDSFGSAMSLSPRSQDDSSPAPCLVPGKWRCQCWARLSDRSPCAV
jgi:hypothetical protein